MTSHDSFYDTALAIIGMSGRFPGASDVDTFWQNIASGTKSIRFYSDEELLAAGVDAALLKNASYVKAAATLEHVDLFDAAFFGYAPREAQITDPQQRFFLECAWEAFESAGYAADTYRGLVGVFAGSGFSTYMLNNLYSNPELMDIVDPLQAAIGNDRDALASTVSYKMNLKGPSISVQTFCSTSLVSVHLACQSLLNYECDMALAGGVAIAVPHLTGYLYKEGGIVSPDGECRTFDACAGGSVMGNGAGVVLLKRFTEAVEDRDAIYAVIRGSAVNNDGSVRVSYTAPGLDGQTEVIAEALGHAGVAAETISYVEAHGTATMLGDSVELAAMKKAFALSTQKKQFCAIGSVKPNVGHLDRASGVTGLIKTSLALSHKLLPPSLNFQQANPEIELENSPFYVNTQLREWATSAGTLRRAGVSSFGLGGTNAHVILEEAPLPQPSGPSRPYQLLIISARTTTALDAAAANLRAYLQQHPQARLADVAYTLQVGRNAFNHRQMLVCRDRDDAISALQTPAQRANQTFKNRGVAFLLSGVGEQYPAMTQELYRQEATFREAVDRCCHLLRPLMGIDIRETLYALDTQASATGNGSKAGPDLRALLGRNGRSSSVGEQRLKQTAFIQPALFVLEYALAHLLMQWGIKPQAMIGFSLGEYVAACLAGVLSLEDSLALVARRAQLIQELPEGAMLAVALSEDNVQLFQDEQICLAAVNSPSTCVLAGPVEAIELLEERLSEQEIACRRVDTTHAFHSTMLEPLRASFTELVRGVALHEPQIPYISNVTGTWITAAQATDPSYWAEHMCQAVRFADGVGHLLQETRLALLEVGPGQVLSSFVKQHPACTGERMALILSTLPSMYDRQSDHDTLLQALGKLWLGGVKIDWPGFYKGERRRRIPLPTYPFERKRYWIDAPTRTFTQIPPSSASPAPAASSPAMQEKEQQRKKADRAEWFYLPQWEQIELQDSASPASPGTFWLIFLDAAGIGEAMAGRLEQQGHTVVRVQIGASFARTHERWFTIRPGERADYVTLCKTLNANHLMPDTVLHCWSVTSVEESIASAATFNALQQAGFYSLLYLTQALGTQIYGEPVQIIVLSNQMQAVSGTEALQPEKATLLSACKIIPQENLNIVCRSIDLDMGMAVREPGRGKVGQASPLPCNEVDSEAEQGRGGACPTFPRPGSSFLDRLFVECTTPTTDLMIAYRDHQRFCQTYHPLYLELPASMPFRHQGVYLITGGLGGVGLVLAEYLARNAQARLVLLGRSGLPARSAWKDWLEQHDAEDSVSQKIRQIQAIEAHSSEVELLQADVADVAQLRQAIQRVYERFGTLHGVIHAAGTSAEAAFKTIQEIGPTECEMHFRPKVYGLYALEQALEGCELDFCLLYSSLSSVLGGLAFAGYTAANIFMDAFVQKHNRTSAIPWISVNWDTWQIKEETHGVLGATVALYAMQPAEATEALARIIACGKTHIVNSTGDLSARIQQWIRLKADSLSYPTAKASGAARPALTTPYAPAREDYEQQIVTIWQHVLGIEPIGIYDNFFELGGHSLIGTQLMSRLRHAFQVDLPLVMLFEAPTIAELALAIKLRIIEEIDQLDEEEAQSLV